MHYPLLLDENITFIAQNYGNNMDLNSDKEEKNFFWVSLPSTPSSTLRGLGGRAQGTRPALCIGLRANSNECHAHRPSRGTGKQKSNCSRIHPEQTSKTHLPLFSVLYHWAIWLKQISRTKLFCGETKINEKNQGWVNVLWICRGENTFSRIRRDRVRISCF